MTYESNIYKYMSCLCTNKIQVQINEIKYLVTDFHLPFLYKIEFHV